MSEALRETKPKKIFVANGVLHGHFTGSVEVVRELAELGHDVTCFVTDEFADRLNDVPVKKIVYSSDVSEVKKKLPSYAPPFAINSFLVGKATYMIMEHLLQNKAEYDYFVFDFFFDVEEMNKVLKIDPSKLIILCPSFILTDENQFDNARLIGLLWTSQYYNINLHDFVGLVFTPNRYKKLILTSKFFHLRPEDTDDTCYFLGPNIENRVIDNNFDFKKDKDKKLLFISLGTVFGRELEFYHRCIEAFRDSDEYQVIMSVGKFVDIKQTFNDIPENFSIYNYVPQTQLLPEVDVFITHAGFNSTSEGLSSGAAMVLVPQAVDQFDVAKVVKKLNAGVTINKREIDVTSEVIKNAVNEAYSRREEFKKGTDAIINSFKEARNDRKAIYEKVFS
ncbi:MAG: hypothetical protein IKI56_00935 [Ruminococcus sp.]|jgi:UDP:flavonoid glycosyltransferase YjiC (YdhE family)|nr:hypothetical protein [Ruminococcus sp.]